MSLIKDEVIAELLPLDRDALAARWAAVFGSPAPRRCHSTLLRSVIGWQLQMKALAPSARRLGSSAAAPSQQLAPGMRLVREWQGQVHTVLVLAKGFEYADARYTSLSAIARQITGTPWSGPLFFGLRK
jgi:hypothetical protein